MKLGILCLLAMLAIPCTAGGDTASGHAGANVHAGDGPDSRTGRGAGPPHLIWRALYNAMRNCEIVHNSFGMPIDCMVTDFQGYPTVVVTFRSIRSMDAHSDIVVEMLIAPFCTSHAGSAAPAQLVFYARDSRLVSVFGCDTGTFSDWARLTIR